MPLFRALAKNMAPMTNADESPTNRLTLFPIYLSLFVVSTLCPGLKFNPLLWFVCFNPSLSFRTCEKKTAIDPDKIYEKIFSSLQISSWKICFVAANK